MKTTVTINTDLLNSQDMNNCNQEADGYDVEFQVLETNSFLPSGLILVLIETAQNVGYNALYDLLKYSLFRLLSVISDKTSKIGSEQKTKITISIEKKKFSINCSFPLSESQQEKIIDAAVEKFRELEVNA